MQKHSSPVKTAIASVLGATLLLATMAAHASVVYSGPVSLNVPATTNGLYLNVVTGANTTGAGSTLPGWDINVWGSTGMGFFSAASPAGGTYVVTAPGSVANLAVASQVDGASSFGTGNTANVAQWNLNSSDNYFGFRFLNEADSAVHFGWAQLSIGSTISVRQIVGYAYESLALTGIRVGNANVAAVPEPASTSLVVLALAGAVVASRRGRKAA